MFQFADLLEVYLYPFAEEDQHLNEIGVRTSIFLPR